MGLRIPHPGQVWEGRTKPHTPITRRKVVEVTDTHVLWEPVGPKPHSMKPLVTLSTWITWAKHLVNRSTK